MKLGFGYTNCVVVILTVVTVCCRAQTVCTGMTPCYCKYENGQFLDLSALGKLDGTPRYMNVTDPHEITYSWNPCFNFTEGACKGVALCAIEPKFPHNLFYSIGYQNTASFVNDVTGNSLQVVYSTKGHAGTPVRTSYIHLICDSNTPMAMNFTALGQKNQLSTEYHFELRGPLACPQGSPYTTTTAAPSSKLSSTGIALIVVGVALAVIVPTVIVVVLKRKGKICNKEAYDNIH